MAKTNYDTQRAQALERMRAERAKAALEAKKAADKAAKDAIREANIVSDAKTD
jgi:TnpA family transposase